MDAQSGNLRVLVVDDEALIRWSITERLEAHGYTAIEADNAASTVKVLERGADKPDVVFLDYRLPDSNDLGLLRAVRALAPDAAVIMMTAFGTPEMLKEAIELGVYRVLSKPFDVMQLPALAESARAARKPL
jgi:two-component system, NtrC family, response regulator AtoC